MVGAWIWIVIVLGILSLATLTPRYKVEVGNRVVWRDSVWVVVSRRGGSYTLIQKTQGHIQVSYGVPKRQLAVVE